jgi:hypothetical protein
MVRLFVLILAILLMSLRTDVFLSDTVLFKCAMDTGKTKLDMVRSACTSDIHPSEYFPAMMRKLLTELFGPSTAFAPGDSVEPLQGGQLMVVKSTSVDSHTNEKIVLCSSFDPVLAASVVKLFKENDLKPIDWYQRDREHN